ncbi:MAG: hypothetical protein COA50_04710 [Flavobacteriaceae bacterium]|nr:MAG: hypothetical protein COA50_04710 [Flavobacteriaceae bacterium]
MSQDAVHNYGTIQIHDTGIIGFHMNLINDGTFDQNLGLVGFYEENNSLTVSGAFNPVFYDTEIAIENGLFLETTVTVTNNFNFITGHVVTPRADQSIFLNFRDNAFYVGQNSLSMQDGYAAITNMDTFTFPVGYNDRLRPLTIASESINVFAKCAYFFEDPNASMFFENSFNTDALESDFLSVSTQEFWKIEGDQLSKVTLTWDTLSNIIVLGELITDLKVVGWSKLEEQWVNLGNTNVVGGLEYGSLTSDTFIPNEYEIITIGGNNDIFETLSTIQLDNYFMTPNGDGKNDYLVIEGLENSPNNTLQIFNRYGVMVYSRANYTNEFNGESNISSAVLNRSSGLESGVYFYIITLNTLKQKHQGYLYLSK